MGYRKDRKLKNTRVRIANNYDLYSKILSLTLEEEGMEVLSTVSSGNELVDATIKHKPDIVLMEIVLSEMDGLAALSIIKYMCPEIPVFIITDLENPVYMARAGELGAKGFFSKTVRSRELVNAINHLLEGGRIRFESEMSVDPDTSSLQVVSVPTKTAEPFSDKDLTDQERLILSFIAMGFNNQSVMEKLHITKNTIKTHIRNIFSKLGVSDRTQAAIWALQHGYGVDVPVGM
jgi:NarL family two-component system response regulator LiaR